MRRSKERSYYIVRSMWTYRNSVIFINSNVEPAHIIKGLLAKEVPKV